MRIIVVVFFLLFFASCATQQEIELRDPLHTKMVLVGEDLKTCYQNELKRTEDNNIKGQVSVSFAVYHNGAIKNVNTRLLKGKITRPLHNCIRDRVRNIKFSQTDLALIFGYYNVNPYKGKGRLRSRRVEKIEVNQPFNMYPGQD